MLQVIDEIKDWLKPRGNKKEIGKVGKIYTIKYLQETVETGS